MCDRRVYQTSIEIWTKSCLILIQYGTIPYFTGRMESLLQRVVVNADGFGQEGYPVAVCYTKSEESSEWRHFFLYDHVMKRMLMVVCNVFYFMKNPLHNYLSRFKRSPQNRTSLIFFGFSLYQVTCYPNRWWQKMLHSPKQIYRWSAASCCKLRRT